MPTISSNGFKPMPRPKGPGAANPPGPLTGMTGAVLKVHWIPPSSVQACRQHPEPRIARRCP